MKKAILLLPTLLTFFTVSIQPVSAQSTAETHSFKQQFLRHFDYTSRVLSLAKAMPADAYSWKPDDNAFSVARVYAHIARYNYLYLESSLGIPAPEEVDLSTMESLTEKAEVVAFLEQSINHVRKNIGNLPQEKLREETRLYGQTVNGQAVLMQLITHYSEHAGQAIAYARMNSIVPPWNQ